MSRETAAYQRPLLCAEQFTATKFTPAAEKAEFGNQLFALIAADFPEHLFTRKLYGTLSRSFGLIAHYDRGGFWDYYFDNAAAKLRFLQDLTTRCPCGDPAFTFSDLERVVIARLRKAGLVARLQAVVDSETEAAERALLNRLQARYQPERPAVPETPSRPATAWASDQASLF